MPGWRRIRKGMSTSTVNLHPRASWALPCRTHLRYPDPDCRPCRTDGIKEAPGKPTDRRSASMRETQAVPRSVSQIIAHRVASEIVSARTLGFFCSGRIFDAIWGAAGGPKPIRFPIADRLLSMRSVGLCPGPPSQTLSLSNPPGKERGDGEWAAVYTLKQDALTGQTDARRVS